MVKIKVCGVTRPEDAIACVEAGVDTIGLNFWPGTPRRVDIATAARVAEAIRDRATVVAVFVDPTLDEIREIREGAGIDWVQLHGTELPSLLQAALPHAYKALKVGGSSVAALARAFAGDRILLDTAVPGAMPGGTGHSFDWSLAAEVARERPLVLAGGLRPDNVAEAVRAVRPFQVDVASGVESAPGVKDLDKVRAFVEAVRSAEA